MFAPLIVSCPLACSIERLCPEFDQSESYVLYVEGCTVPLVMWGEELDIFVNDPANRGVVVRIQETFN